MLLWHWSSWSWMKSKKGRIQREKVARLDSICMFGQELPTYRSLSWPVLKCTYADTSSVAVCPSDFPSQRVSFLEHGPLSGLGRKPGQWQRLPYFGSVACMQEDHRSPWARRWQEQWQWASPGPILSSQSLPANQEVPCQLDPILLSRHFCCLPMPGAQSRTSGRCPKQLRYHPSYYC